MIGHKENGIRKTIHQEVYSFNPFILLWIIRRDLLHFATQHLFKVGFYIFLGFMHLLKT